MSLESTKGLFRGLESWSHLRVLAGNDLEEENRELEVAVEEGEGEWRALEGEECAIRGFRMDQGAERGAEALESLSGVYDGVEQGTLG